MRFSSAGKSTRTWCNVVERGVVFKEILAGPTASLFSIDRRRSIVQMPRSGTTDAKSSSAVYLPEQTRASFFPNIGTFEETKTADVQRRSTRKLMLLIGERRFSRNVAFAATFRARLTGVVTLANDGSETVGIFRPTRRRVVTRQSPITILLCRRRFQRAFNAREINRFAVIQRINPVENDKAVGVGRERSSGPIRVGTATKKREDGSNDFSLLFTARETRREELVKTSIRCQPITYRVYA